MRNLKRHIVIFLLTVFTIGSTAGLVMAHCGHNSNSSGDSTQVETSYETEKECGSHEHGQAAAEINSSHDMDHDTNPAVCDDCSGVPCHTQIRIPEASVPVKCVETGSIHSKTNIKIKPIYLFIIPVPPKQLA